MEPGFADHFSAVSAAYARFRPRYPAVLFAHLAALAPARTCAWDCATGSGQAALSLAACFARVVATDASAQQVAHAEPHPRVHYVVARAEASGLATASVDLIAVAQALHWFDRSRFYAEARRVLRPAGVLAVWSYGQVQADDRTVQRLLDRLYFDVLGQYWPAERQLVDEGYRSLEFPFPELPAPSLRLTGACDLQQLVGYLGTWSAVQRYRRERGSDPIAALLPELQAAWGGDQRRRTLSWPLSIRLGRLPAGPNATG